MTATETTERLFRIGHSPDPDDAFMFYALSTGRVKIPGYFIEHRLEDIETLNHRAMQGEYEMTAISAHAYPSVAHLYQVMNTGASMGRGYGPVVIATRPTTLDALAGKRIAIPGEWTTAHLLYKIYAPAFEKVLVPFDQIMDAVRSGRVDAGVIIHEGQLTYADEGFVKVADFGEIWERETDGLPLPLGLDAVRRDLGPEVIRDVAIALSGSIRYGYEHEEDAMEYARQYGRGIAKDLNNRFVRMYVSDDTIDMGEPGRRALARLYEMAVQRGFLAAPPPLDFV